MQITGEVYVPDGPLSTTYATAGKVYLYTEEDLTVPKDSTCLNPNHCYEFEELEPGVYYVYVKEAMHCVSTSHSPRTDIYRSEMVRVEVRDRSVVQDILADEDTGLDCDVPRCDCVRGCPNYE